MDWLLLARFVHIVGAVLWAGAAIFFVLMVAPGVRDAGPSGGAVMAATLRRGGFGRYFGPVSTLTVLAGLYLYAKLDFHKDPFADNATTALTLGMALGILAWLEGLMVLLPLEAKLKALVKSMPAQGPPPPEKAAEFQAMGMKMGKATQMSAGILFLALLLMASRTLLL
ncbi:MAG TPA: hypothetical protein VI796_04265 [Candidatus Thermoplasmatota archaeon]|nr:hypothetical protein [Candidatus Thermoplasmatota archaeon]